MYNPETPEWLEDVASRSNNKNDQDLSSTWITNKKAATQTPIMANHRRRQEEMELTAALPRLETTSDATTTVTTPSLETTVEGTAQSSVIQQKKKEKKTWGEYFGETIRRDGRLVLIAIVILICMNVPYLRWALYPFTIFSTWIHEICHGLAAEMVGGDVLKLEIFPDGSGLAYNSFSNDNDRLGFVSSAGYQGTAVVGCLLLLVRRTKRGPRTGCMAIAVVMLISVLLWIRNIFGIAYGLVMGVALVGVAIGMPSQHMRNVYVILAVTCTLNAITSVQNLFGTNHMVNGKRSTTDAHAMAANTGGTAAMWATLWLLLSILLTIVGVLFAIPGADEVADFTICGLCQDIGCFKVCNAPGRRIFSSLLGNRNSHTNSGADTTQTSAV